MSDVATSMDGTVPEPPPPPPERMAPVSALERIDVIDILRGVALFGILAANMRGFNAPAQVYFNIGRMFNGTADVIAQGFIDIFIQGKFVTLFAFLFGIGFAVQMSRAAARGQSVSFYARRLAILLGIGLIHAWLIWWGDILVSYAVTGFILLLFRKAKAKTVGIWAICLYGLTLLMPLGYYVWWVLGFNTGSGGGGGGGGTGLSPALQNAISVYRDGSFWAATQMRFRDWWSFNGNPIFLFIFVLPRFLAGLWVYKIGLLTDPERFVPRVRKVMWWALAIGIAADLVMLALRHLVHAPRNQPSHWMLVGVPANFLAVPATATFYACCVFLAARSMRWLPRIKPFAAVGRMALTTYLTQSFVFTWFFALTNLYGKVGPAWNLLPTVIFFTAQVYFSNWWLQRYQFGPVEWAWRCLTYGSRQPMRRNPEPPMVMVAEVPG
jgi:uncharacterized protein